jgi:hypothetical protein
MPDRIIRDELLTSERYWNVSDEAKLLYIHLLISADDTARYTGKNFSLRTRCFPSRAMESTRMETLLSELVDQDLIRLYEVDKERFVFIPRFKQRLRFVNSKYPEPPNQINDLVIEKTVLSQTKATPKTDSSRQKRSEEKRSEEIRSKDITPEGVSESIFKDYLEVRKAKKAKWTQTALKGLQREAEKAKMSLQDVIQLCCERNWVGFKAEWANSQNPVSKQADDKSWMFSNEGIEAKARELGVSDYGVANHFQLKDKILQVMAKKALQ